VKGHDGDEEDAESRDKYAAIEEMNSAFIVEN
jgi:hypothetical protein